VEQADRPGAKGVGDDRGQLDTHAVELLDQGQRASEDPAAAGHTGGRHEDEPANPVGLVDCDLGCNETTERVPDDIDPPKLDSIQEPPEPRCDLAGTDPAEPRQLDQMETVGVRQPLEQG